MHKRCQIQATIATSPVIWVLITVFLLWRKRKVNKVLFTPVKCDVRNKEKHIVSPITLYPEEIRERDIGSKEQTNEKENRIKYCS